MNATVKRKFNALVQGIGNSSPSSTIETDSSASPLSVRSTPGLGLTRTMTAEDILNKRRRVGTGGGTASPTPSRFMTPQAQRTGILGTTSPASSIRLMGSTDGGTTTISNVSLRKFTPRGSPVSRGSPSVKGEETGKKQPPKYCPADRGELLRRLATFQELTDWTPKPERISEIEWAKRGWVCLGKERVRCTLCERELVVKIGRGREVEGEVGREMELEVIKRYENLMDEEGHGEGCLWRGRERGCDDSLLRLPLPNSKWALTSLRQRYDEMCQRKDFLPYEFNLRLAEGLDLEVVIGQLPTTFFTDPKPADGGERKEGEVNRPALALALMGWQGLTNPRLGNASIPNSASCHSCLRRLGLWMFKSRRINPETNEVLEPAPMDHLDPVREHRFFCPWKNAEMQRNPGAKLLPKGEKEKPAWEVVLEVLKNESFIRERVEGTGGGQHGRSKSSAAAVGTAKTPERPRPTTAGGTPREDGDDEGVGQEEEEEARKKKDQDVMSRLRRVKSLFNTKGGKLSKRLGSSRPGTSGSVAPGE
ncbi:C3HC zinc finger-like-domain-containing protein [Triangularia verruculosa]|uniref:C3HC zinc finger-like-domain-containing protein n=1 Tax=Triangularia verruculosa TaxID=2587418 RepID=A0AAN6XGH5_9PEZI|nr:C3HC zinc finger-like-domain-containing protein [Triangularia verruculosa]